MSRGLLHRVVFEACIKWRLALGVSVCCAALPFFIETSLCVFDWHRLTPYNSPWKAALLRTLRGDVAVLQVRPVRLLRAWISEGLTQADS